jgi:predicted PurR-regulated permease PerM
MASEQTLAASPIGLGIMIVINAIKSQAVQPWLLSRRFEVNPVALCVALASLSGSGACRRQALRLHC